MIKIATILKETIQTVLAFHTIILSIKDQHDLESKRDFIMPETVKVS